MRLKSDQNGIERRNTVFQSSLFLKQLKSDQNGIESVF